MSSDDDYDDSSSDDTEKESVSEEAEDDEEEIDDDEDEVENDADETLGGTTTEVSMMQVDDENAETIEKILKERQGIPGATGPTTTVYNMEEKGDPNAGFRNKKPDELERQFLIKWVGWSHLHNTWESEKSLKQMNAKGMKKLDHYIRKQLDNALANRYADKEYMEYLACEEEMGDELLDEYRKVERVIAHQFSRDKNSSGEKLVEYYIKWSCLPYSECTWEDEGLIKQKYGHKIEQYFERINSKTLPNKTNSKMLLRKRPKFQKLEYMPDFLKPIDNPEMELRDYQLEGLNWLLNAYCKENSCILADEMGLGKTIQTISFLSTLFHLYDIYGPFLIVVPLSTMTAWQREFELWAPKLNSVIYMGDASSREQIRQYELIFPNSKKIKINALLTTYELLLKDKSFLSGFDWSCLVIDEAHRLKNNESLLYQCLRNFNTGHRLLITGTPLQNSLKELWALLHFIMPEKFDSWPDFEREHENSDHKRISALHKKIEPYLLRRVKKDVEKSLPAKVEQILRVDMTAQQKQFYKWILTRNYKELSKGVKGSINGFVNLIMELKKCCNHCSLVRNYDNIEHDPPSRLQQLLKSSGKLILLDKLLCRLKETGHRVLIFSQMVMMLDILQEYMELRRFNTQRLDGSMRADLRKQALDHFNADNSTDFCFLLSTRAGGLGINLATADTVIIFDSDWNPQNDLQAMSRAHRIGQKKTVNIYRFVTKNSVEEEIVERAKRKLVLDHLVIQRMDTTGKTVLSKSDTTKMPFDKTDLTAILKFGAEDLFKEKEGEEQEPEVDIDDILKGAETRECDNQETGNDLLNSFKYANFAFDEEKDLAEVSKQNLSSSTTSIIKRTDGEENDKEWSEIIPEETLDKIKEEERKKIEDELNLGPRQRTKIITTNTDENLSDDYDDDEGKNGKRGPYKKKALFNFTETEIRKFSKSLKKFSHPLERLDAIAQDAELEEHSTKEIEELCKEVMKRIIECSEKSIITSPIIDSDGKKKIDRGPIIKIGTVDIYVRPLLKQHHDLESLHRFIQQQQDGINPKFKLPITPKRQYGWDIDWDEDDDISILRGIYKYGMGSWESIKMDPEFGLADKIWIKDKIKKPQPKHLQSRIEYLLKLLAKELNPDGIKTIKRIRDKKIKNDDEPLKKKMKKEKKKKEEENKHGHHHSHNHNHHSNKVYDIKPKEYDIKSKERSKSLNNHHLNNSYHHYNNDRKDRTSFYDNSRNKDKMEKIEVKGNSNDLYPKIVMMKINEEKFSKDLDDQSRNTFKRCVELFRPVHKYIKKLSKNKEDEKELDKEDYIRYLCKLGDHIANYIESLNVSSEITSEQEKWHSYLWIFLSKFITQEPKDLHEKYQKAVSNKIHKHQKQHSDRR